MTEQNKYTKGSEWRKWDLHVHTPLSIYQNYGGNTKGSWERFIKDIESLPAEFKVIGINDYLFIDGYEKVLYYKSQGRLANIDLFLPIIEFRLSDFAGVDFGQYARPNIHVIFSNELSVDVIKSQFLATLEAEYKLEKSGDEFHQAIDRTSLEELGKQIISAAPVDEKSKYHSPLEEGFNNLNLTLEKIKISLKKSCFIGKYLLAIGKTEWDKIKWSDSSIASKKTLINSCDIVFTSAQSIESFKNAKAKLKLQSVNDLLLDCSDAHNFSDAEEASGSLIKDRIGKCFTWIKADTTFEGLKQIIYESEERIAIQESNPMPLKSSQTISRFDIRGAILEPELKFEETTLFFNEGLVAVTGGKGSGKTALVDLIANLYKNRANCDDNNSFVRRVLENKPDDLETTIKLKSDKKYTKEIRVPFFIEEASVVYVAQGELENHVRDPAHLEAYINSLIFKSNEIKDSELLFDYRNINDEIEDIKEKIKLSNKNIFTLERETDIKIEEEHKKNNKKLSTDITDSENKIKDIARSLSAEKINEAQEKQKQLTELRDKKAQLEKLGITIKNVLKFSEENFLLFNEWISNINTLAIQLNFTNQFKAIEYPDVKNLDDFIVVRGEHKKTVGDIDRFQKELDDKEKGVKEHTRLLDHKKELEKSFKKIQDELTIIEGKKEKLLKAIEDRQVLFEKLIKKRIEQKDKFFAIIAAFSAKKNDILSDLEFTAELIFDQDRFVDTMYEIIDGRKIKNKTASGTDSYIGCFVKAMETFIADPTPEKAKKLATEHVTELLSKILSNKKQAEIIDNLAIYNLVFENYLDVKPSVKYKKVKLLKLSLGQKATVLIKIYLAQGEDPIIIDSHDDYLGNEFIMEELIKALRQAKQNRQIIVVSNNGNMVVNSDAEQVIIACRSEQGEISYLTGSLEHPALRSKLLRVLEGGEEAFTKRQQKYRIHK